MLSKQGLDPKDYWLLLDSGVRLVLREKKSEVLVVVDKDFGR